MADARHTNEVWTGPELCTCGRTHPHSLTPQLRDNLQLFVARGTVKQWDKGRLVDFAVYEDVTDNDEARWAVGLDHKIWGDTLTEAQAHTDDVDEYAEEREREQWYDDAR